jgi:hypothetical protein
MRRAERIECGLTADLLPSVGVFSDVCGVEPDNTLNTGVNRVGVSVVE